MGDAIDCGGQAQTGSSNVFIGDRSGSSKTGDAGGTDCQKDMAARSMPMVRG